MVGYPGILSVIEVRLEWVVRNAAEAGISLIYARRFLIGIGVGRVKHQSLVEPAFKLCLKSIGLTMTIVAIGQQKIAQCWISQARKISVSWEAIPIIRSARRHTVAGCGAPGIVAGSDFIEVDSTDEASRASSEVRISHRVLGPDLAFEGCIVLLDCRLAQTHGNSID